MSDNYVGNVLGLLRLIKRTAAPQHATLYHLQQWSDTDVTDAVVSRLSAYILDQLSGAHSQISQSALSDEAKAGLLQTVTALQQAFALQGMNNALQNYLPQIESSISQFAILVSATGVSAASSSPPTELEELFKEIFEVKAAFEEEGMDPLVRDTARKHLHVLVTLLRNVETLGVDAALAAYAELVIRLRRVDSTASETTRAKVAKIWPKIEQWTGRLAIIDQALNAGTNLLSHFKSAASLLHYLPKP